MLPKFFGTAPAFWLLIIPFIVQHVLVPLLEKLGVHLPPDAVQKIIDFILSLLQGTGLAMLAKNGHPPLTVKKQP
jgi:hypothetical protein